MSDNILQPDLDALHQSAIDILTHVSNVMEQGSTLLKEHGRLFSDYRLGTDIEAVERDLRHVKNDLKRVKQRELTMTIVAPTSAGKSTIINAIAEQDLLPRRDDPMTIVPTEIVFLQEASQAKFILDDTLLMPLREAWQKLHNLIQEIGMKETLDRATQASFLRREIVNEIANTAVAPFHSEVKESYSIPSTLEKVNDVFRLCNIFDIPTDFLSSLPKLPRIEVPLPSKLSSNNIDRLVLIDTPGVTESKSVNLGNVVRDRLKASSLILLVLDCNAIGQEAPEKVKNMVDEIATIKGRDRIYIAINQIDRRNSKSLTTEEILDLAKTKYEIEDPGNRVFEISGLNAFIANNFWHELNTSPATPIERMKTVDALGSQYYGEHWSEFKAEATLEKMNNAADRLWQKSGFDRFIDTAIAPLVGDAKPSSIGIKAALKDTGGRLSDFQSCLERQKGMIDRDIQQIESRINHLRSDLREISTIYKSEQLRYTTTLNRLFDEEIQNFSNDINGKAKMLAINLKNYRPFFFGGDNKLPECIKIFLNEVYIIIENFQNRAKQCFNAELKQLLTKTSDDFNNQHGSLIQKLKQRLNKIVFCDLDLDKYVGLVADSWEEEMRQQKYLFCQYKSFSKQGSGNGKCPPFLRIYYEGQGMYGSYSNRGNIDKSGIQIYSHNYRRDYYENCEFHEDSLISWCNYIISDFQIIAIKIIENVEATLAKDIHVFIQQKEQLIREYERYLQSAIQVDMKQKNRYEIFKDKYIQLLDEIANLQTNLKYQRKYS